MRMIAGELRQPSESEIIRLRCRVTVVRLQQTDDVLVDVVPPALRRFVFLDPVAEFVLFLRRHGKVSGKGVVERGDIGRSLNRRMPTQREDASTRPSDVAEEK